MRTISYKLDDLKKVVIPIGYEGENDHTRVIIDAGEVFKQYPAAAATLKVKPPHGTIYPVVVNRDGDRVIWNVKDTDCASDGNGEAQFTFTENNVIVKSVVTKININRSLIATGPAPNPIEDWLDEANEALEEIQAAEVNQPTIGEDGYWYTWNQETGEYEKTETKAQGADGAPGQDATPDLITKDYDDLTFPVTAGTQCYHDGLLYYAKQDIQTAEAWTAAHWQNTTVEEQVTELKNAIQGVDYSGKLLKNPVKNALLNLFNHVVFTDGNAQIYIDALNNAWGPDGTLDSITAVFTQGSAVIYTTDSLDVLRQYLVVTGTYIKDSVEFEDEISDYTLSGTLTAGTSTITVTYGEETATFTVDVTDQSGLPSAYQRVEYIESTGTQFILFNDLIDNTTANLSKYEFNIDCECTGWNGTNATNIVIGISTDPGCWLGYNHNIDKILIGTSNGCYFSDKVNDRNQYHYSFENGYGKVERDDGAVITREFSGVGSEARLCLFSAATSASNPTENNNFRSLFKLYSLYLTREGTPKYNMIPCYRKSDNVIGLYNTVDETFYTNNGTGTFNKGSDVNV